MVEQKEKNSEVLTASGFKSFEGILCQGGREDLLVVQYKNKTTNKLNEIVCTQEHRFLLNDNGYLEACFLEAGMILYKDEEVVCIKEYNSLDFVYDLVNVDDTSSYFTNNVISHNCLYLDEYAHVSDTAAEDFSTSVFPTLSAGKDNKLIITSTPKGFNHYYKIWNDAIIGRNGYKHIHVTWDAHPERDQDWETKEIALLGEEKFRQEHLTEFLGSSKTLISSQHIRNMSSKVPIQQDHQLTIYQTPEELNKYLIVCDPSRGTGNDYSAFIVFDISEYPFRIVAKFKDNKISPTELSLYLFRIGRNYNNADILVEINDNGQQIASTLFYELDYENTLVFGIKSGELQIGVRTTKSVKAIGCQTFKELIEAQKLLIEDFDTIEEISHFVNKKTSYEAETGYHDDLVMCCVLFSWFATTQNFTNLFDINYKDILLKEKEEIIEQQLIPFGIIDDGLNEETEPMYPPENGISWQSN